MQDYKIHTLETITLADFLCVYLGEPHKAIREGNATDEQAAEAAIELVSRYSEIVGGASSRSLLSQRDEMRRMEMRITALKAAEALAASGAKKEAVEVLQILGIKASEKNVQASARQNIARSEMQMAKIRAKDVTSRQKETADAEYFTRERVAVMRWAKMRIDPQVFTAAEYAYLVREMSDEAEAAKKAQAKAKRK